MANNDLIGVEGLVDKITRSLEQQLGVVDNLTDAIRQLGTTYRTLPSNVNTGQQNITQSINAEIEARRNLLQVDREVERQRRRGQQLTSEEIVNQRQLRQNADREAIANSQLAGEYQRLNARRAQAARIVQDLTVRGRTATQTQRQYNRELRTAQREFDRLNSRVTAANRAVGRFQDNVGNYPQKAILGLKDLVMAFGVVGGVSAFAAITKSVFDTTKELQSLDLALTQVINNSEQLAQTQQFLSRIAEDYGIEIQGLTRSYTQFYVSAKDKLSGQEIQNIFESISKAAGAMGLSVEQQEGAFTALTQMLSKGNIQAEELRGQLSERLPGAFRILAESMGVTEVELNKLLKDGQVLAADVLPAFAEQLEKAYNIETLDRVETLSAETSRLSNSWTDLVRALTEGDSIVTKAISGILEYANSTLDGLTRIINLSKEFTVDELVSSAYTTELEKFKSQAYLSADALKEMATVELGQLTSQLDKLKEQRESIDSSSGGGFLNFLTNNKYGERQMVKDLSANSEAQGRLIGRINALNDILAGNVSLRKEQNDKTKKGTELTKEELKAIEKKREEELKNQYTLKRMILESEQRYFEERMENEKAYYAEREEAARDITLKEMELAELAKNEGLRLAKGNKTQQLIVWEEYYKEYEGIVRNDEERINKLKEDAFDDYKDYTNTFSGEGLNVFGQGESIADDWFDKQKEKARQLQERIDSLRDSTRQYLDEISTGFLSDSGFGSLTQFFDKTFDPLTGKFQTTFEKLYEGADTLKEKFAVTFNAVAEVAQEAFNFMNQLSNQSYQLEYENLEMRKETALKFAGESQAAQDEINRQYEEKRKEIRRRELKAQKEQAIFNAIINTAQGVTAAYSQANIPLAVIIAALGAAQVAFIAAQQVPAYAEGTMSHPGGLMLVNDAKGSNYKEVIQHPDGTIITPSKRNVMMDAPKGTKVFKNKSEFERQRNKFDLGLNSMLSDIGGISLINDSLNRSRISDVSINNVSSGITKADMDDVMNKYSSRKSFNVNIDREGMRIYWQEKDAKTVLLNNTINVKSNIV
jgi:tape measure domain-containing protein